jgi:hypothetical protein
LNDEETYIRIEAIEIITQFMDEISTENIENDFIPSLFNTLDA